MAEPLVDFTPVLRTMIPFIIFALVAGALVNAVSPARRQRRRERYSSDPPLVVVIASQIARWIARRRALRSCPLPPPVLGSPTPIAAPVTVRPGWTLTHIQELEWKRLEILTANLFESLGFNAKLTSVGADGGIDVILRKPGSELPVGIAQCKAWTTHKVGVKPIREFFGVMSAEKVEHGIFVTTSTFTDEAREFAEGKNLELIDGDTLISFIRQLPLDRKTALFDSTFSGDYSTPTCPNCDVKMVTRTARTGLFEGSSFWGCPHYPRCSHTFPMRKDKER